MRRDSLLVVIFVVIGLLACCLALTGCSDDKDSKGSVANSIAGGFAAGAGAAVGHAATNHAISTFQKKRRARRILRARGRRRK